MIVDHEIVMGGEYLYLVDGPPGCKHKRYRAHRIVIDVPTYQHKVLMESLPGNTDAGLWFTITVNNFRTRYRLAD